MYVLAVLRSQLYDNFLPPLEQQGVVQHCGSFTYGSPRRLLLLLSAIVDVSGLR